MKLKYTFELMELDDEVVAVPVGQNADEFHGIVKFNSTAAEIIKLIQEKNDEADIVEKLNKKYESSTGDIKKYVSGFLTQLREAGLIEE